VEQLEFEDWWNDFQSYHKNDKDGGYEAIKHLKSVVGGFIPEKRFLFIDELILTDKQGIAAELIELYGSDTQKELIRERLTLCIKTREFDYLTDVYLQTVIGTYQPKDHKLIKLYYKKQVKPNRVIPIELFKIDKKLFLFAFRKMFRHYPETAIYEYDGLLYLIRHLDILEYLIDNLRLKQAKQIQKLCKVKSTHSIVNNENWKEDLIKLSNKKLRLLTHAYGHLRLTCN